MKQVEQVGNELTAWIEGMREDQNAPGTLEPCPFCKTPRNQRSDYIRCRPCGLNWLEGEDLNRDPRLTRKPLWAKTNQREGDSK